MLKSTNNNGWRIYLNPVNIWFFDYGIALGIPVGNRSHIVLTPCYRYVPSVLSEREKTGPVIAFGYNGPGIHVGFRYNLRSIWENRGLFYEIEFLYKELEHDRYESANFSINMASGEYAAEKRVIGGRINLGKTKVFKNAHFCGEAYMGYSIKFNDGKKYTYTLYDDGGSYVSVYYDPPDVSYFHTVIPMFHLGYRLGYSTKALNLN